MDNHIKIKSELKASIRKTTGLKILYGEALADYLNTKYVTHTDVIIRGHRCYFKKFIASEVYANYGKIIAFANKYKKDGTVGKSRLELRTMYISDDEYPDLEEVK